MRAHRVIAVLLLAGLTGLTGLTGVAGVAGAQPEQLIASRFDQPRAGFAPEWTTLHPGTPQQAGVDPAPVDAALAKVRAWTDRDPTTGHPMYSGAVTLMAHDGVVLARKAEGYALRYSDVNGTELPADRRVATRGDTIFDMASISKLFTSITVLRLIESGKVDLTAPMARYLPEFAANGKGTITIQQLLTHTSGLPPDIPLWRDWPDRPSRIAAALAVTPQNPPGTAYVYSDLNMISLGALVEKLTGATLDVAVRNGITEPLDMRDTGYNPPASKLDRIAATEFEAVPPRGLVRGQVHDENAWSLNGIAGHAGVFSTADDIAVLGQAILNGGSYRGHRILRPDTVSLMLRDYNQKFPDDSHGLGFELDQRWYMGALDGPRTAGHTGYTGTTLVIDPASRSIAVLLTNRVHPTRNWGSINPARRAVADGLAQSLAVRPTQGPTAWFAGLGNRRTATLTTAPLTVRGGSAAVSFDAFLDIPPADSLTLESSTDGGANWKPVRVTALGPGAPRQTVETLSAYGHRSWWRVRADVSATGPVTLRWRSASGDQYSGRGSYVDGIRVTDSLGLLVDAERNPGALTSDGWRLATH